MYIAIHTFQDFYIGVHNDAELIIILEFLGFLYLVILSDAYFIHHRNKKERSFESNLIAFNIFVCQRCFMYPYYILYNTYI